VLQGVLERNEMGLLRWMLDVSVRDKWRNEDVRRKVGVACSITVMKLVWQWFGRVYLMDNDN